ncbi:MAG: hypothetical protein ACK4NV_12955 [Pannonibacter sp.]
MPPREAQVHAAVPADASSFSQRVQRHSELWVLGLVVATPEQLVGAAWREGKGVGMEVLLYVEPFQ